MSFRVKLEFKCNGPWGFDGCPTAAVAEGFAKVEERLDGNAVVLDEVLPPGWKLTRYGGAHACPACAEREQ